MYSILEQLEASNKTLDAKRVAVILGISEKKLYQDAEKGRIPCIRIGVTVKFDPATLSYWVRCQSPEFAAARREATRSQAPQ
jgi:hypothetical protein